RMIGYEPNDFPMTGQAWIDLIHPEDREKALMANKECIENRSKSFECEFRMITKTGEWKWILGRGSAVSRDSKGIATRMTGTHIDITERKRAEEELKRYRDNLEDLVLARTEELMRAN